MGDFSILAKRIKKLRTALNMTQKEFSAFVGCTAATLSAYENGSKSPSLEIVKGIAEKCDVSIDWLCGLSNNRHTVSEYIWTYADVIRLCHDTKEPMRAIDKITQEFIKSMQRFMSEASHMEKLKQDKLIDQELYDLWLEKELKKRTTPIMLSYCDKIINPFTGEEA